MPDYAVRHSTTEYPGGGGDTVRGYFAEPDSGGRFPGVILISGVMGITRDVEEFAQALAKEGYLALALDLYSRVASPDLSSLESARKIIATVADSQVVADLEGSAAFLQGRPNSTGRVGVIGFCAGGRYTYIFAARSTTPQAAVACYGPVMADPFGSSETRPVAPIDMAADISCPLLGLYGDDDQFPSPDQIRQFETELKKHGKMYQFHSYPNAGHAFFSTYSPAYRPEAAKAGWAEVLPWFKRHLS